MYTSIRPPYSSIGRVPNDWWPHRALCASPYRTGNFKHCKRGIILKNNFTRLYGKKKLRTDNFYLRSSVLLTDMPLPHTKLHDLNAKNKLHNLTANKNTHTDNSCVHELYFSMHTVFCRSFFFLPFLWQIVPSTLGTCGGRVLPHGTLGTCGGRVLPPWFSPPFEPDLWIAQYSF